MVDLPPEIWNHIACYLTMDDMRHALSINRALFDISMGNLWGEVHLETRYLRRAMHLLQRLSDPYVASRVKVLVLRFSQKLDKSSFQPLSERDRHNSVFQTSLAAMKSAFLPKKTPGKANFSGFMSQFIACTPLFTSVRNVTIDTWDLASEYDLGQVYFKLWATIGGHLESLTLEGSVASCRRVIDSEPTHTAVKYLRFDFTHDIFRNDPDEENLLIGEVIAPFINSLSQQLQGLKICCWPMSLDLSQIFLQCNSFPILQHLCIRMKFDAALRDPSGLKNLLWNTSSTLEHLEMRLNPTKPLFDSDEEISLCSWLLQCFEDEKFLGKVDVLDIYPTNVNQGAEVGLVSIRKSSGRLRRLNLRDRYHTLAEALAIIEAASKCQGLRALRLNLLRLDIQVMDCMAEMLPNLDCLWMTFGHHTSSEDPNDTTLFGLQFHEELGRRSYDKWRLQDLSLWQDGAEVASDDMEMFSRVIPSLQSFFGNGHMRRPNMQAGGVHNLPRKKG